MHLSVIDEDHAALFAAGVGEEGVGHGSEEVHDGRTDAEEIELRHGLKRVEKVEAKSRTARCRWPW